MSKQDALERSSCQSNEIEGPNFENDSKRESIANQWVS